MMAMLRKWLGLDSEPPPILNGTRAREDERWTEDLKVAVSTITQADAHSVRTSRVAKSVDPASALRRARGT